MARGECLDELLFHGASQQNGGEQSSRQSIGLVAAQLNRNCWKKGKHVLERAQWQVCKSTEYAHFQCRR